MRAIITTAPVELEGDADELAHFVNLMTSGQVLVEHRHRWRIADTGDENGNQKGRCDCGEERTFTPYAAGTKWTGNHNSALFDKKKNGRKCSICQETGHTSRKCPSV